MDDITSNITLDTTCTNESYVKKIVYISSYLTLFSSCLSIFGSALIILTFILWKDVRQSVARIILLFLALADLGTGLGYLISSIGHIIMYKADSASDNPMSSFDYPRFCTGTSFINTYFPVCSFFWTGFLAIYFVMALVVKKTQWSRVYLIAFNLIAWLVPLVICIVAVSIGVLGGSGERTSAGWCFVAINGTTIGGFSIHNYPYFVYLLLEAVCGKGWELLFYFVVIVCYSVIICVNRKWFRLKKNSSRLLSHDKYYPPPPSLQSESNDYVRISLTASNQVLSQAISKIDWKLLLIPFVFVLLRLPGTYRYFLSFTDFCNRYNTTCLLTEKCFKFGWNYNIMFLQAMFDPLQGFGNAFLFVFLSKTIMKRLSRILCCNNCHFKTKRLLLWPTKHSNTNNDDTSRVIGERSSSFTVRYSPIDSKDTAGEGNRIDSSIGSVQLSYGSIDKSSLINK